MLDSFFKASQAVATHSAAQTEAFALIMAELSAAIREAADGQKESE